MTNLHIDENGNKHWYNSCGEYHRDDGPAFEGIDGDKFWCRNGQLHREDGPATDFDNVYLGREIYWYINGKRIT
jgi:hypothetical protein